MSGDSGGEGEVSGYIEIGGGGRISALDEALLVLDSCSAYCDIYDSQLSTWVLPSAFLNTKPKCYSLGIALRIEGL